MMKQMPKTYVKVHKCMHFSILKCLPFQTPNIICKYKND